MTRALLLAEHPDHEQEEKDKNDDDDDKPLPDNNDDDSIQEQCCVAMALGTQHYTNGSLVVRKESTGTLGQICTRRGFSNTQSRRAKPDLYAHIVLDRFVVVDKPWHKK